MTEIAELEDFRLHDGRMWSSLPTWEQQMLIEDVTDLLGRFQRIAEMHIDDILTVATRVTNAAQQMGAAIIEAMQPVVAWGQGVAAMLDGILRVPDDATIVRPIGHRSNSRQWLAWDGRSWHPCRRRNGAWYWVIEEA